MYFRGLTDAEVHPKKNWFGMTLISDKWLKDSYRLEEVNLQLIYSTETKNTCCRSAQSSRPQLELIKWPVVYRGADDGFKMASEMLYHIVSPICLVTKQTVFPPAKISNQTSLVGKYSSFLILFT